MNVYASRLAAVAGLACGSVGLAQNTPEVEPNELRTNATPVAAPMAAGHTLTGTTTGSVTTAGAATSLDQFRVKTALDAPAIYRYRLVLTTTGTAGHTGTIRGFLQTAAAAGTWPGPVGTASTSDTAVQTSTTTTTPARFNQWYGFGKGEELYYRVTGTTSTTASYTATLERTTVTPTSLGNFPVGPITFTSMAQTPASGDTEFWVYDGNFNAIAGFGNDDNSTNGGGTGVGLQSLLTRTYAAGTYHLAVTSFNFANNLGSPCDDNFRTGAMLDFPDIAACSTTGTTVVNFTATGGGTSVPTLSTRSGAFDINWFKFTVGTVGCYADCDGVGGLTANDFICFVTAYNNNQSYADCDGVGGLTANDFICFVTAYNNGCT